ncbi:MULTISPECIES: hypothetical protein [Streptomyces]|uniref:hypothetical protein n=1 Tax=Streptomyces TaxID=1883 RepID=UPI00068CCB03|nr:MULTISPECIES: hypothetical protein [unclassified Streptomyces]SEB66895.1 hypothetical protein SAMN05216482_0462 [Streptomyces sp. PAN_FS17]SEE25074.1 hypothetical protein SAMN05428938_7599 [Streptomyces sp. KS_5]
MRVYDRERQEWAGGRRERLYHPDQYLDLPRQRRVLERTGVVLAVVGVCFGVWAFAWKDEPEPPPPATTSQGESAPAETGGSDPGDSAPEESPTVTDAGSGVLPDGYEEMQDEEGFSVAVPTGWSRESSASQFGIDIVNYRSSDGLRRLQIFQVMEDSPYGSLQAAQTESTKLDGYELIELTEISSSPYAAAEHEYRASEIAGESDTGSVRHVVDHRFEASDGNRYALVAYGPDNADGAERDLVDTAVTWFCPPSTTCPTPGG